MCCIKISDAVTHPSAILRSMVLRKLQDIPICFAAIKVSSILLDWCCAFTVFYIFKDMYNRKAGFIMACIYLFLINANPEFWAFNIPLMYLLPVLLSMYLLFRNDYALSPTSLFMSGFLIACATLISTNVIFYALMIPAFSILKKRSFRCFYNRWSYIFFRFYRSIFFSALSIFTGTMLFLTGISGILYGELPTMPHIHRFQRLRCHLEVFLRVAPWYPFSCRLVFSLCIGFYVTNFLKITSGYRSFLLLLSAPFFPVL